MDGAFQARTTTLLTGPLFQHDKPMLIHDGAQLDLPGSRLVIPVGMGGAPGQATMSMRGGSRACRAQLGHVRSAWIGFRRVMRVSLEGKSRSTEH
jgi:hypothetical protein